MKGERPTRSYEIVKQGCTFEPELGDYNDT